MDLEPNLGDKESNLACRCPEDVQTELLGGMSRPFRLCCRPLGPSGNLSERRLLQQMCFLLICSWRKHRTDRARNCGRIAVMSRRSVEHIVTA
ncbi:MAG: hypothetical protein ACLVB8_29120 [Bacteroides thetaiotaomicron]